MIASVALILLYIAMFHISCTQTFCKCMPLDRIKNIQFQKLLLLTIALYVATLATVVF